MKEKKCEDCGKLMFNVANGRKYCQMCSAKSKYKTQMIGNFKNGLLIKSLSREEKDGLRMEAFVIAQEQIKKELGEETL